MLLKRCNILHISLIDFLYPKHEDGKKNQTTKKIAINTNILKYSYLPNKNHKYFNRNSHTDSVHHKKPSQYHLYRNSLRTYTENYDVEHIYILYTVHRRYILRVKHLSIAHIPFFIFV